jgi:hypothetical protein
MLKIERIPPINIGINALENASLKLTTLFLFQKDFTDQKAPPAYKIGRINALIFREMSK